MTAKRFVGQRKAACLASLVIGVQGRESREHQRLYSFQREGLDGAAAKASPLHHPRFPCRANPLASAPAAIVSRAGRGAHALRSAMPNGRHGSTGSGRVPAHGDIPANGRSPARPSSQSILSADAAVSVPRWWITSNRIGATEPSSGIGTTGSPFAPPVIPARNSETSAATSRGN